MFRSTVLHKLGAVFQVIRNHQNIGDTLSFSPTILLPMLFSRAAGNDDHNQPLNYGVRDCPCT